MRITLHTVRADEYTAVHEAMLGTLRASRLHDRRFQDSGLTIADADDLVPHVVEYAAEPRTREEIEGVLGELLGTVPHKGVWWALRTFAPLAHAVTGGAWSFGRVPEFIAAPTEPERPGHEEAVQHLLRRYLEAFGPATAQDFAQFALLRQTTIRPALQAMAEELVTVEGPDGTVLLDVPQGVIPEEGAPAPPRLLPMWDSILLAYADRTRVLPEEYRSHVIRRNGDVLPTLLVDGLVCGVWRPTGDGIDMLSFQPLPSEVWDGLGEEAAALNALLADRDSGAYRRYANWWGKLPDGERRIIA